MLFSIMAENAMNWELGKTKTGQRLRTFKTSESHEHRIYKRMHYRAKKV